MIVLQRSLRTKIIFFISMVSLIPLLVLSGINGYQSYQAGLQSIYKENGQLSIALANDFESMIASRVDVLRTTSQLPQVQSLDMSLQVPILQVVKQQYADFASVTVVDSSGQQVARDKGYLPNIADRAYFKEIKQGASVAISDVILTKATGRPSIVICLPVKNSQGIMNGAILATVDLLEIANKAKAVIAGEHGFAYVTDNKGNIISHPNQELVDKQENMIQLLPVQKTVNKETGAVAYEAGGQRELAGYAFVPSTGWGIIVQLPESEALAKVQAPLVAAG
jgi:methyl-accepting chemotaxis protein